MDVSARPATQQLKPFDEKDGLQVLRDFERLLGTNYVVQSARFFDYRMRTAFNDLERACSAEALHPLHGALSEYMRTRERADEGQKVRLTPKLAQLAADAFSLFRFREAWDDGPEGRRRNYVVRRLKSAHDSIQCLYEFRMATFMELQGAAVNLRSAGPHQGHDIELDWNGTTVDVECKYMYPWAGRKIHTPTFNRLFEAIVRRVGADNYPAVSVTVICDDRLEASDLDDIANAVPRLALLQGNTNRVNDRYLVEVKLLGPIH
jgi:hypothetical protein